MSKARILADLIADSQLTLDEIADVTATASEVNTLDGITATTAEINHLDGVTSNIQTQFDDINVTVGTLTKTFASGEQASITLAEAVSPAPVVSVTKEVAQVGITSKGGWDVATDGANYELHDTAYDTTLTPGTITDLANASYDSVSFSVSSEETNSLGLSFNNDGTKMYIVGGQNDEVNQYSLSTAYDLSTASFDSVTFSVASQDTSPRDVVFNTDGTKMFVLGQTGSDVNEYTLSTAFDISSASFVDSFSVSSEDTTPVGMKFNTDGTKMYVVGLATNTVYQYSLSTAFDISTASYDSVSFSVASQETTSLGIAFNNDGTAMYIVGNSADEVNQYTLSTAFDLSTASFDSVTFIVTSQETTPTGVVFNSDGTKMYIVGVASNTVYQYTVGSDALVLGSGSFASTDVGKRIVGNGGEAILTATDGSYSEVTAFNDSSTIASGDWSMFALTFDGTDGVTLSGFQIGFADASTWSYDGVSFSVGSQGGSPGGLVFNNDGTKMYILDFAGDEINQYSLSTAFDISTASFDSVTFDIGAQETTVTGLAFNNDGTKMYITGSGGDEVNQYTLSTAFDVSTASFDTVTFSVGSQDTQPQEITFNTDGTKMYILGRSGQDVNQYTLSTAFDISTASFDSVTFSVASEETFPTGIAFNNDGTKMYIVGSDGDEVNQYTLATAFDISTASFDSATFSIGSEESDPEGIAFNNDGTKMYIVGTVSDSVHQYSTGALFAPTSQYHPTITNAGGQIDTAFWTDINTMTADETLNGGEVYYAVSTDDRTTWAVIDDTDGVRPIVRNNAGTWEYNDASTYAGTTWTSATTNEELYALQEALEDGVAEEVVAFGPADQWSYDSVSFSVAGQDSLPYDLYFKADGTKFYVLGRATDSVYQYILNTPFDLSTASYDNVSFSVTGQENQPNGITFKPDGTKLFVTGTGGDDVNEYTLDTAWDVSTASYVRVFDLTGQTNNPNSVQFKPDGTKMYMMTDSDNSVYQYSLSTPWNIGTASYDSVNFSIDTETSSPDGMYFKSDGTKMYITDDKVYQYSLSSAWDISTASYDSVSFDPSSVETNPVQIQIDPNGLKMFLVGTNEDSVQQFTASATNNLNRMNSTQLDAVTDPNHYTLGDTLDLAIMLYTDSAGSIPESDGVSINYDAEALNQGAVVGTDYDFDFPDSTTVRITSNAAQNLKVRVV